MNNLRRIRRSIDLTQYQLSQKARIPQSTLSLIERFYKVPDIRMKKKIAKVLKCKTEDVFPNLRKKK